MSWQRFQIFGNGFGIFALIGIEIGELQVRFGKIRGQRDGLFEKRFDLGEIHIGILGAFTLPQAHGIEIDGFAVVGLEFGVAAKALDDFFGLARGTIEGAERKG